MPRLPRNQLNLTVQSVAELRFGALVAGWGDARRTRLEQSIEATTVVPVTDRLISVVADIRYDCRTIGHPLGGTAHHSDLWIAATAIHIGAQLVTADGVFQDVPGLVLA